MTLCLKGRNVVDVRGKGLGMGSSIGISPENKKLIAARMAEMAKANTEQAEVS